jgi:outer membrane protein insertion porin family
MLLRDNKIEIKQNIHPLSIKEDIHLKKDLEYARQLKQDLLTLCKQKANTKTLNKLKINLWLYNKGKFHSDSAHFFATKWWDGFRTFIGKHLGEEPVIYDSILAYSSLQQMRQWVQDKGYLYSKISYSTKIKRKRATVTYTVIAGKLFRVDSIYYPPPQSTLGEIISGSLKNTLLHPGMPYDLDLMKQETDRITNDANNSGYCYFVDSYMYFDVDTITKPGAMTIRLNLIKKPQDSLAYNRYTINNIYVYPDTVIGTAPISLRDTISPKAHFYIVNGNSLLHPKVFLNVVAIHSGNWYSKDDNDYTIERISDLNVFNFVNIEYKVTANNQLDCYIYLIPAKREAIQAEFDINNYTNNPIGNQLSLTYLDKNLFNGADQLRVILEGGVQFNPFDSLGLLNTVDLNGIANLTFPKFIGPQFINNWFPARANPKTDVSLNYTYTQRLGYFTLNSGTVSFGWDWHESAFKHHIFNPLSISILDIEHKTAPFDTILVHDPLLEKSYATQVIIGGNYSFIWTDQVSTTQDKFFYFRATIDVAGNILEGANYAVGNTAFPFQAFNLPFAQFAKLDLEYRYYYKLFHRNYLVFRFAPGIGVAYGNYSGIPELPYTEQFYLGGPNSIRGWQIRSLGPGEYTLPASDVSSLLYADQTADIKIEGNLEYRFDIFGDLKGAIFTDFGNIWTIRNDTARAGAVFKYNTFFQQIAIASGVGLRYDFGFFVIRLDLGIPIKNPALPFGQRWITTFKPFNREWFNKYEVINIAIGYPF